MIRSRFFAIALSLALVVLWTPANAQVSLRNDQIPRIFGQVQSIQLASVGALIFEDADTAVIGELRVQLFGIKAPDVDENCVARRDDEASCGLLALTATLELVDGIDPLDCLIVAAEEDTLIAHCLSDEFDDVPLDRESNNLAEILVLQGWARADDKFDGPEFGRFRVAELAAQQAEIGFWDCDESTPRSWSSDKNKLCN
jgi:endonuclease YncB( thermonuclease family)